MPRASSDRRRAAEAYATSCDGLAVGARLRGLRHSAGLTQAALAERLGTTQSAVARLEAGHQRLSLAALQRAALASSASTWLPSGPRRWAIASPSLALGSDVQLLMAARKAG
jgi:transcriptional regulator with XRE-family HTH domain